jgi:hypothetical protein
MQPTEKAEAPKEAPKALTTLEKIKLGVIIVTGIGVSYIVDDIIASNKNGHKSPFKRLCMAVGSLAIGLYVSEKVSIYAGETFITTALWAKKVTAEIKENTQGGKS